MKKTKPKQKPLSSASFGIDIGDAEQVIIMDHQSKKQNPNTHTKCIIPFINT